MDDIQYAIRLALAAFTSIKRLNPDLDGISLIHVAMGQLVVAGLECGAIDETISHDELIMWAQTELARVTENDVGPIDLDTNVWGIDEESE